jgi:hypothetical protein
MTDNAIAARMRAIRAWIRNGPSAQQPSAQDAASPLARLDLLRDLVADMDSKRWVKPQPFASSAPVVGPLVVAVRSAWNWMSTKWYILPLLEQQNRFNVSVARLWAELVAYLSNVPAFAQETRSRFEKLEAQVEALTQLAEMPVVFDVSLEEQGVLRWDDLPATTLDRLADWCALQLSAGRTVDLSCGNGEMMERLAARRVSVYGVESDAAFVEVCAAYGLQVSQGDALAHLASLLPSALGGAMWLAPGEIKLEELVRFFSLCHSRLVPGGVARLTWAQGTEGRAEIVRSVARGVGFSSFQMWSEVLPVLDASREIVCLSARKSEI